MRWFISSYSGGCLPIFLEALFQGCFHGHRHPGPAVRVVPETGYSFAYRFMVPSFQILTRVFKSRSFRHELARWSVLWLPTPVSLVVPSHPRSVYAAMSLTEMVFSFGRHLTSPFFRNLERLIQQLHVL